MNYGELFAGVGMAGHGFSKAGWQGKWFVEIEDYPHKVYQRNFPDSKGFRDVRECGSHNLSRVDVIFGGFPCQDLSVAGKQTGISGKRSGLFYEFARIVSELRPRWWILENVTGLLNGDDGRWFERVLSEMASLGYDATWHCIPACAVGAPHRRDRVWIVGYAASLGPQESRDEAALRSGNADNASAVQTSPNTESEGLQRHHKQQAEQANTLTGCGAKGDLWEVVRQPQPRLGGDILDGITSWMDEPEGIPRLTQEKENRVNRLKVLGNGLMWHIPYLIAQGINELEKQR